jgi:hypothetical protein
MAEHQGEHGAKHGAGHQAAHGAGHGAHDAAEHRHGEMDITDHQKTFEGFLRFWVLVFGGSIFILILLALFNS